MAWAEDFFEQHPLFRFEELEAYRSKDVRRLQPAGSLLASHLRRGHIVRVRRGVYCTPDFVDSPSLPLLVGAKAAPDAVLSAHSAIEANLCATGHGSDAL